MANIDTFIRRKHGKEEIAYPSYAQGNPEVTYGVIIYQEQVMRIAQKMVILSWAG